MTIKWIRLKEIIEEIAGQRVVIHASTQMTDDNLKGVTGINRDESQILLNLARAKSISEIIDILAHETAHIVMRNNIHNGEHTRIWNDIRDKIKEQYYD